MTKKVRKSKKANGPVRVTRQSRKTVAKVLGKGPIRLKQPTLNGLPRVRNARLDKYAEAVGECRDSINEATREIKGYRAAALKEMLDKKFHFWSHGGVDFIVTPGEAVLKIKTSKRGSAETGAGEVDVEVEAPGQAEVVAMDAEDPPASDKAALDAPF